MVVRPNDNLPPHAFARRAAPCRSLPACCSPPRRRRSRPCRISTTRRRSRRARCASASRTRGRAYDERFGPSGARPRSATPFSADSLGSAQFPRLAPDRERRCAPLAIDPALRLSLGQLRVGSNARIVTTPIALEYGVTRRLSLGVLVPVVQTRRVAMAIVDGDSARANVGYVVRPRSGAAAASATPPWRRAYRTAADSLGALLARLPRQSGGAGCAAVNANPAAAAAARARALVVRRCRHAAGRDRGRPPSSAPRATSALADTLDARRVQLNQRLQQYLGATRRTRASVFFAPTDFSYIDLQGERTGVPGLPRQRRSAAGSTRIHTTERIGFGDIAVGAQLLVFDRFQRDAAPPPAARSRGSPSAASLRFATSRPDSAQSLLDIPDGRWRRHSSSARRGT